MRLIHALDDFAHRQFRGCVWGVLAGALVIRLALAWTVPATDVIPDWAPTGTDALQYHALARGLADGDGYGASIGHVAYRPPGYPVFLAGLYAVFGSDDHRIPRAAQSILGTLLVALVMRCAWLLWSNRSAVVLAGVLVSGYPFLLHFTPLLLTETLFSVLSIATLWTLLESARGRPFRWFVFAGVLCALASLTRPTLLPFAVTGGAWALWATRRGRLALLFTCVALATIAPWTVRNYVRTGAFIPISTNGSLSLRNANDPDHDERRDEAVAEEAATSASLSPPSLNLYAFASSIRHEPIRYVLASLYRAVSFWSPWPKQQPRPVQWAGVIAFAPLLVVAPFGFRRLWRTDLRSAWLLIAFVGTFYAVHVLSVVHIRFRVPLVDPVLILLAAGAFGAWASRRC